MKKCLDCNADLEKSGVGGTLRCGPCGVSYSATVSQRRYEGRLKVTKKGTIKYKGRGTPLPVLVEDLSHHGAKVRYAGDTALFYNRKNQRRFNPHTGYSGVRASHLRESSLDSSGKYRGEQGGVALFLALLTRSRNLDNHSVLDCSRIICIVILKTI